MERHIAEALFESGELDEKYAEFIMENSKGDRVICNGDMLTEAMEDSYLYEEFMASIVDKN